ncbi:MAG: AAA family ATPase [Campylobacterales bacterium]|nr:AAA family ATPase [Campylobacterales bacterium]
MSEHFIKNIEIKNFKCFEDFKAEGFGRVNLIGGKNNVGKTAFMEACYVNSSADRFDNLLFSLSTIERNRDRLNIVLSDKISIIDLLTINGSFSVKSINEIEYIVKDSNLEKSVIIKLNGDEQEINSTNKILFDKNNKVVFIDNSGFTNFELKEVYKEVQFQDKDILLNEYLQKFDLNISTFKIISDKPYIKQKKSSEYMELSKFGDGVKQYISIICSLYSAKDGYLFIDELENGIHYTNLDKLWEIILTISKQQNVQVFATTHSKECIESYARVAKKLEDEEETKYIELFKDKDQIKTMVLSRKQLDYQLKQNHEVR